ncbi:hypothetical protein [Blastococcus sp. TF02A-35]|uniref:hypothetical protein n=1 Tax=Blastococcus sp. TF02A-35 TaxID=2559612 RepID=UPI0010734145|nr:hypothetical protein [Blastococcus sp. TF02A_35]TFV47470.1 hypothetical protein E4P43_15165 [Blastococcus sp. TF02A_35]
MRIVFRRMADRRPVETLVERDDGVVFAMRGAGGGADLPHDLVHALVEQELGVRDGIWGCVADGVVWGSMRHVSGRRPPRSEERSVRLKRERTVAIHRAEALADVVGRCASGREVLPREVEVLGLPRARLDAAALALRDAAAKWAALSPGEEWVVEWGHQARGGPSGRRRRG